MKTNKNFNNTPKKKGIKQRFCPNRQYVKDKIDEFLQNGGKISKIENLFDLTKPSDQRLVDEYLCDSGRLTPITNLFNYFPN